jgi:hypothetical protein
LSPVCLSYTINPALEIDAKEEDGINGGSHKGHHQIMVPLKGHLILEKVEIEESE